MGRGEGGRLGEGGEGAGMKAEPAKQERGRERGRGEQSSRDPDRNKKKGKKKTDFLYAGSSSSSSKKNLFVPPPPTTTPHYPKKHREKWESFKVGRCLKSVGECAAKNSSVAAFP